MNDAVRRTCSVDDLLKDFDVGPETEKGRILTEARLLGRLVVATLRPANWDGRATVLTEVQLANEGAVAGEVPLYPGRRKGRFTAKDTP